MTTESSLQATLADRSPLTIDHRANLPLNEGRQPSLLLYFAAAVLLLYFSAAVLLLYSAAKPVRSVLCVANLHQPSHSVHSER